MRQKPNKIALWALWGSVAFVIILFFKLVLWPEIRLRYLLAQLDSHSGEQINRAVNELARMGPRIVPRLLELIQKDHPNSASILNVLSEIDDPSMVPTLNNLLQQKVEKQSELTIKEQTVVSCTIFVLAARRDPSSIDCLSAVLVRVQEHIDRHHRLLLSPALIALAEIGDERALPKITPFLVDDPSYPGIPRIAKWSVARILGEPFPRDVLSSITNGSVVDAWWEQRGKALLEEKLRSVPESVEGRSVP